MEKSKPRKEQDRRRFTCEPVEFSSLERGRTYNEKNKFKKHSKEKNTYENSPNSYINNWPTHARQHPFPQRLISDSTICHYSVPLGFSFEPVSLPIYSALVQPQRNCALPLEFDSHLHKYKYNKGYSQNKKNRNSSSAQNEVPAIFHTPRILSGDQQDYTSLPPVNCNLFAPKSSDTDGAFRRRFSDPGVGQMSSDDCASSSSESCDSLVTPDAQPQDFLALLEQVNELKENNNYLQKELNETKLELETLKMQFQNGTNGCEVLMPGALSDAINEIRNAVKLGEEALISKVIQMLENNTTERKEAQARLEEKLRQDMYEKLSKLEEKMTEIFQHSEKVSGRISQEEFDEPDEGNFNVHRQLLELEQEKIQLQKDLQEAVSKRRTAEATTEKLERLVGILRKKINGVSLESCLTDEKHIVVRPLSSALEKNPFIIANNRQGQKLDTLSFQKPKIPSIFRAYSQENDESENTKVNENKENDTGECKSNYGNGNAGSGPALSSADSTLLTAQVTITGPVTDL